MQVHPLLHSSDVKVLPQYILYGVLPLVEVYGAKEMTAVMIIIIINKL